MLYPELFGPIKLKNNSCCSSFANLFDLADDFTNDKQVKFIEDDDKYSILASLPGFTKDDISIELKKNKLLLKASKKEIKENEKGKFIKTFELDRMFYLNEPIDKNKIEAKLKDGILELIMPKLSSSENVKIKID